MISISNLELESQSECYWKGEDFFLDISKQTFKDKLIKIYSLLGNEDFVFKLGDVSFLKNICSGLYELLRGLRKYRFIMGDYYIQLVASILRSKFYSLEYYLKMNDDLYIGVEVQSFLKAMFEVEKSFLDIPFKVTPEVLKRVPSRYSSETILYLQCLSSLFSKAVPLIDLTDETTLLFEQDGTYLVTILETKGNGFNSKADKVFNKKDDLATILSHNFRAKKGKNLSSSLTDNKLIQCFAWTL